MIDAEKRKTIWVLYKQGKAKKEIARYLNIDPKTVRCIIEQSGVVPTSARRDKKTVEKVLLEQVYRDCDGWMERVHEVLIEKHGIEIGYSTLTSLIRELELGKPHNQRCDQVPDKPGAEMQHDTSPYTLKIGSQMRRVQCSGLYFRYSKMRYIKFYYVFNRFVMKCFFYEALKHFGYSANECIVDNTNLAILSGSGPDAVFVSEMNTLARGSGGFSWKAHKKGHSNRKAGKERNFWTVETNFFPGRSFKSLEDLNRQGFDWALSRYAKRPGSKTGLIPIELFEIEKPYLKKLPSYVEPPYQYYERLTDRYGYIAFYSNFYWVPGTKQEILKVIEYPDRIKIYKQRKLIGEYLLPGPDVRNEKFKPEGVNTSPYQPRNRKQTSQAEEQKLRQLGKTVESYLDFMHSKAGAKRQIHKFIRELYYLSRKLAPAIFLKTCERAIEYRINNILTLERISIQMMRSSSRDWPQISFNDDYQKREAYLEGRFSNEPDLSIYQDLLNGNKNESE